MNNTIFEGHKNAKLSSFVCGIWFLKNVFAIAGGFINKYFKHHI